MTHAAFASLPAPPYYAVIFSSLRSSEDAGSKRPMANTPDNLAIKGRL